MLAKPEPGLGDVEIELDGRTHTLVPTWDACQRISNRLGGIGGAIEACAKLQMEPMVEIIQVGLGLNPQQAKKLPESVYKAGLIALQAPCIRFCRVIASGGRLPDEEVEDAPEDPPLPA